MGIMLALSFSAAYPTSHFDWGRTSKPADYAICSFRRHSRETSATAAFESMVMTDILLAYGYFIRLLKMIPQGDRKTRAVAEGWSRPLRNTNNTRPRSGSFLQRLR